MPVDLPLDPETGDLNIVDGDIAMIDGAEAVRQRLTIKLSTFLGEWFDDPTFGVPYKENIFTKPKRIALINATMTRAILEVPGVNRLLAPIEYDDETQRTLRKLLMSFAVNTDFGIVELETQVP